MINILNMSGRYAYFILDINIRSISDENLGCLSAITPSGKVEGSISIL